VSANRYLPAGNKIAQLFPDVLREQGLEPLINRYILTETERGNAWLFVVMDDRIIESIESYAAEKALSSLSTAFQGHPVFFSNSNGLYYAVLLSSSNLPRSTN